MKDLYVDCLDLQAQARTRVVLIASRSVAFSDHHDFIFVVGFFLLMALFRHTRDISPDGQKA